MDLLHQRGKKGHLGVVRCRYRKDILSGHRVLNSATERMVSISCKTVFTGRDQFKSLRGRPDALPGSNKQRILKGFPEPFQGATDSWLRKIQSLGRSADTALIKQNIEHNKEIEINIPNIVQADNLYQN